jgi:hypothetical protein
VSDTREGWLLVANTKCSFQSCLDDPMAWLKLDQNPTFVANMQVFTLVAAGGMSALLYALAVSYLADVGSAESFM